MSVPPEVRERLAELVELQPTKNAELRDRWDMESGSDVHAYLEGELADYYYRDDDSMIRATPEAVSIVSGEAAAAEQTVTISPLQDDVLETLPGPEGEPRSVVATFHALEDAGVDATVDEVRSALHGLADMGVVERVQRTVPTFRLAVARGALSVEVAHPA